MLSYPGCHVNVVHWLHWNSRTCQGAHGRQVMSLLCKKDVFTSYCISSVFRILHIKFRYLMVSIPRDHSLPSPGKARDANQ